MTKYRQEILELKKEIEDMKEEIERLKGRDSNCIHHHYAPNLNVPYIPYPQQPLPQFPQYPQSPIWCGDPTITVNGTARGTPGVTPTSQGKNNTIF